jgi:pilus assembly protein Flp/PilA
MNKLLRFLKEEGGPTAIEYAFVISLILVAAIAAIALLGQNANESMDSSAGSIGEAVGN